MLVPAGTAVPVHVVGTISSGSAKKGDSFQIQAAQDVVVNGMVVIPQGAGGEGIISDVDSAGGNGHSCALSLSFTFIFSADETCDVGNDFGSAVTYDYPSEKKFSGEVTWVEIDLGKDSVNLDHLISPEERLHFAMGTQ